MRVNIYSVYKISDLVMSYAKIDYTIHIYGVQFFNKKITDIRVSKIPQGTLVNGLYLYL